LNVRVLLTGASGFVGSHCLDALVRQGCEVIPAARRPPPQSELGWRQVDLLDPQQATALVRATRPTHLLHLAWEVTPGAYWTSPLNWQWLDASRHLLEAFAAHGGQRAVMVGTCAEYGAASAVCHEGHTPLAPTSVYGACKAALGITLPVFGSSYGLRSTAWARLFYLYGPREQPRRLVPSVIRSLRRGERRRCPSGAAVRDYVYIEDAADALVTLLGSDVSGAINVATGQGVRIADLLTAVGRQIGRECLLDFGADDAVNDEPAELVADVGRLRRELGWRPSVDLEDGARRTVEWWCSEAGDAS
jgi:nucleoside-diphosphate-sugar epimerase